MGGVAIGAKHSGRMALASRGVFYLPLRADAEGLEILRLGTSDDMSKARAVEHLELWGSAWMARLMGCQAMPTRDEVFTVVVGVDPPREGDERQIGTAYLSTRTQTRSDLLYDASRGKYESRPKIHVYKAPALDAKLTVDTLLAEMHYPPILTGLLLHLYPTTGNYAPDRGRGYDPENPYRSFRPDRWNREVTGGLTSNALERHTDSTLRIIHRDFLRRLADRLSGKSAA